jgi:hypothetical protein
VWSKKGLDESRDGEETAVAKQRRARARRFSCSTVSALSIHDSPIHGAFRKLLQICSATLQFTTLAVPKTVPICEALRNSRQPRLPTSSPLRASPCMLLALQLQHREFRALIRYMGRHAGRPTCRRRALRYATRCTAALRYGPGPPGWG